MTYQELLQKGQTEFSEFCRLVEGKPYDEIPNIVNDNKLDYGMFEYGDDDTEEGLVDINYKSLCVTVFNMDGMIGVKASCEVWDENDTPHSVYFDWYG